MSKLAKVVLGSGLLALGCSGGPARCAATVGTSGLTRATVAAPIVDTCAITAPALVSAGMAQVLADVPAKAGATYLWSISRGTIPGVVQNAAVYFNAGTVSPVTLTCAVTLAGVTTTYVQDVPVVPVLAATPTYYGSGYSADSLANTVVGGLSGNVVSYRFQARYNSPLRAVRPFFIWSAVKLGYAAGQGGTIRVDLKADDNSNAHLPTGPALASTVVEGIIPRLDYYPEMNFPYPAALTAGTIYHLVFTNIDPDPVGNYISLDALYTDAQTAPMQPVVADADFAVLVKSGAGAWKLRQGFTPTLALDYAAGSQGNGYMEVWSTNPKAISGQAGVREVLKVSGASRTFSKVNIRLSRTAGASPLTVRVEESGGALVTQAQVPASAILQGIPTWITVTFPLAQVLNSGVNYHLVLSSPADTSYSAFPMRKGQDKGYANSTVFADGHAQFTTTGAAGWQGWDMWGTPNLTFSDLQFAFLP